MARAWIPLVGRAQRGALTLRGRVEGSPPPHPLSRASYGSAPFPLSTPPTPLLILLPFTISQNPGLSRPKPLQGRGHQLSCPWRGQRKQRCKANHGLCHDPERGWVLPSLPKITHNSPQHGAIAFPKAIWSSSSHQQDLELLLGKESPPRVLARS